MDLAVLNSPPDTIPPDTDAEKWLRYVRGAKALDFLYSQGKRCVNNESGVKCLCDIPRSDYCKYYKGIFSLAQQIGGETFAMINKLE